MNRRRVPNLDRAYVCPCFYQLLAFCAPFRRIRAIARLNRRRVLNQRRVVKERHEDDDDDDDDGWMDG